MLVRGLGIRNNICEVEEISIRKVLSVLVNSNKIIILGKSYCETLEVESFGLISEVYSRISFTMLIFKFLSLYLPRFQNLSGG